MENKKVISQINRTFHNVIIEWPESILIENCNKNLRNDAGLRSAWDKVENTIGIDDPWKELMVWVIYKSLHAKVLKIKQSNPDLSVMKISPRSLIIDDILSNYIEVLNSEEWNFLLDEE